MKQELKTGIFLHIMMNEELFKSALVNGLQNPSRAEKANFDVDFEITNLNDKQEPEQGELF